MHIAIVGAGSLGQVYGVKLAGAQTDVSFVVRPERAREQAPFTIEQVGTKRRETIEAPRRVASVPSEASAVIVAVRFDQLSADGAVAHLLRGVRAAPIIIMTPLLPAQIASLEESLARRVLPAMPGVAGYVDERGVVRFWVTPVAATLLDDPGADPRADESRRVDVEELARRLSKAGIPARLEANVGATNAATTMSFFPLIAAIDAGGGIELVLKDRELLQTALDAARETEELARKLGKPASWAHLLTRFIGPLTVKPGVALAKRIVPEAVHFIEQHFGAKLHAQHLAMGDAIVHVAREIGAPVPALEKLLGLVRARGGEAARAPHPA